MQDAVRRKTTLRDHLASNKRDLERSPDYRERDISTMNEKDLCQPPRVQQAWTVLQAALRSMTQWISECRCGEIPFCRRPKPCGACNGPTPFTCCKATKRNSINRRLRDHPPDANATQHTQHGLNGSSTPDTKTTPPLLGSSIGPCRPGSITLRWITRYLR